MFQRVLNHGSEEKTMDIKIFETVVHQVWATFPGYCDLPLDSTSTFDQAFAELISNLLYQQTNLRVDLCRGLQNLVESNQALLASDLSDEILQLERRITRTDAEANLAHLATLSNNIPCGPCSTSTVRHYPSPASISSNASMPTLASLSKQI